MAIGITIFRSFGITLLMADGNDLLVWALIDDRAGNKSQCLGVAEALGRRFEIRNLEYTPVAALPNFVIGASFGGLSARSRANLTPPWPDVVISAGRRSAPIARNIKKLNGAETFLAQIMYPGDSGADEFDLIAVPGHDNLSPRPNLMTITGAPHRITTASLAEAAEEWKERFQALPRPWIALIVGGSTKRRTFTNSMARELGRAACDMAAKAGGSLLVSTSRRSGEAADVLIKEITCPGYVYRWGDEGKNPYVGYLATADAVIVTGDSVSMCSEACAAPVPVYLYAPAALITGKHARLHQALFNGGYARPLGDALEDWTHPPLNPADEVAAEIRRRLGR